MSTWVVACRRVCVRLLMDSSFLLVWGFCWPGGKLPLPAGPFLCGLFDVGVVFFWGLCWVVVTQGSASGG
jgi:hypothetical protein